jgi:16S rRNA (adenine(1408)-N(1))-methyltransferase
LLDRFGSAEVHVDFGTGDGAFVRRAARLRPEAFVVGLDAVADNLREVSRLAAAKPARGGLPNALFGRMALEQAPGELFGLAHALTVHLPWGSLLQAVARAEPEGIGRLRALCRPGAQVRFLFGYDPAVDRAAIAGLDLPPLADLALPATLESRYRALGLLLRARRLPAAALAELPTTWAQKLARTGRDRSYLELRGQVCR